MVVVVVRVRERTIGVAGVGIESVAEEHCADSELNPAIPFILRSCSLNCELGGGDFGFSAGLSHPLAKKLSGQTAIVVQSPPSPSASQSSSISSR